VRVATAGPIDAYVAALSGALRGPRATKADLVIEARDGLADAAARYEEDGLDRAAAERAAVEEFGAVADLAPEYQRELALAQGRRTAILIGLGVAAQSIASELAWRRAATGWTWRPNEAYSVLARLVDYTAYSVVAGALLAALVFGIGTALLITTHSVAGFYAAEAVLGLGYGVYAGVDLALVLDVLPDPEDSAKDLGVFNIANAAPQSIAPAFGAMLVDTSGGHEYHLLLGAAAAVCVIGSLAVIPIRTVR